MAYRPCLHGVVDPRHGVPVSPHVPPAPAAPAQSPDDDGRHDDRRPSTPAPPHRPSLLVPVLRLIEPRAGHYDEIHAVGSIREGLSADPRPHEPPRFAKPVPDDPCFIIIPGVRSRASPDLRIAARTGSAPSALLGLSAWCGTIAGLLEVVTVVVRKRFFDTNQLLSMSRHFIWLVPLTDLLIFLLVGLVGSLVVILRPSGGRWAVARTLVRLTLLPMLLAAFPQVYGLAWLLVALGLSARLVPVLERHGAAFRRVVLYSSPILALTLAALAAAALGGRRVKQRREQGRPIPPDAPNILLIVMDTVAADHLDLYGYARPTSPAIDELARRGSRFDAAHLGLFVDPPLAREHVHRAMASRAVGRLADPARRGLADGGRVPA